MGAKGFRFHKSLVMQIVFILIILYAISSLNLLIVVVNLLPHLPDGFFLKPFALTFFNVISVTLMVLLAVYHLVTMFHHKKRKNDHGHDHYYDHYEAPAKPQR